VKVTFALIMAAVWSLWGFWPMLAICTAIWLAAVAISVDPATPAPVTITRLPTQYEQHRRRWGLGFGLALSFVGLFPFVVLRRR